MTTNSKREFEVFFDGGCPLCRREMDMIRRKDSTGRLLLTDISSQSFELDSGPSLETLMKEIHGRHCDGSWVTGVQVFREIYTRLGWRRSVGFSKLPVIRNVLDAGYRVFAYWRYRSAAKRMHRILSQKSSCDENSCAVDGGAK